MKEEDRKLRETTVANLSGLRVGTGNVFERDLPDARGVIAPRMSAVLAMFNPQTKQEWHETVIVGSVLALGADRYCVVGIDRGRGSPGWVTVRKLAP